MNDSTTVLLAGGLVAATAFLAHATSSAPSHRLLGGRVGRYESGGRKFVTIGQATRHHARTTERIAELDAAIDELRKQRRELSAQAGIRDSRAGFEYATD